MIRKIVVVIVCFAAIGLNAQDGTVSPYSYFGAGEPAAKNTVENQMMGGIGIYTDSIHLNLNNPAGYGGLRLTTYAGGISYKQLSLENASNKESNNVYNIDYLSLGFQVSKGLGVGFGLQNSSSVGYNILSSSTNNNGDAVVNSYSGYGGVNKVYFSLGYEFSKSLSLGATFNYNFGKIESTREQTIEGVQLGTFDERVSNISGVDINYALNYTPKIDDKHTLYTSLRVNTQANLTSRNTQNIGSFSTLDGLPVTNDEINLLSRGLEETDLKIPATSTFGLGYGENKKWFLGAEYSFQSLSDFKNDFTTADNLTYEDASTFAIGGYYTPDYTSFTSYFQRVTYRAGLRMENTGLIVNETEINNLGITFGVGLPLANNSGSFSNVNIGFEIGKKGTTDANLIKENYFKINIGLSLNDRWFVKRKIN